LQANHLPLRDYHELARSVVMELELSPHLLKRMLDRRFNEVDLRIMLDQATGFHNNHEDGRFVIETSYGGV
jgi:hypothetical protein